MQSTVHPKLGLALLYSALFAGIGVNIPFLPLWLQDRGLTAAEIGIVVGAPLLARMISSPAAGEAADRTGRPVRLLRFSAGLGVLFYLLVEVSHGFWPLLIAASLAAAVVAPAIPLTDSLAVAAFRAAQGAYGPVRAWGSVAFIGGTLLGGLAIGILPVSIVMWLIIAMQVLALTASFVCVADLPRAPAEQSAPPPSRRLLHAPLLVAIAAAALTQASHAAYYAVGSIHWRALGLEGPTIGILWSVGVLAEIGLFWGSGRLSARVAPAHLLIVGSLAAVLRWVAMAADPSGPILVLLQALHALSFAATYLGMIRAVAAFAPPGLEARAQGVSATVHAIAMAAAMAMAGQLHAVAGGRMYLAMGAIAALGGLVALGGLRWSRSAP